MIDILLFQSADDGDLVVDFADIRTTSNIETAIYLSWFGGNSEDTARGDNELTTWWGNHIEDDADKKQVSRLQHLMNTIPLISGNLRKFEEAAKEDITWLEREADELTITASIPALNTLKLVVDGLLNGERFNVIVEETG